MTDNVVPCQGHCRTERVKVDKHGAIKECGYGGMTINMEN
jgi:hypothetical protein